MQASPEDYGTELLRRYHENLSEIFTDNQMLLNMIPHLESLAPGEREVREGTGEGGVKWESREKDEFFKGFYILYKYTHTAMLRNAKGSVEKK